MNPLRVFIADDEAPARARLRELLADIADELPVQVVGEAQNGLEVPPRPLLFEHQYSDQQIHRPHYSPRL